MAPPSYLESLRPHLAAADERLAQVPLLVAAERATHVPKVYIAAGAWLAATLALFLNVLAAPVSNAVAVAYPSYMALSAAANANTDKLKHWVLYFVAFAAVSTFDLGVDLWSRYIPFYYVFRTLILVWLAWPNSRGAAIVYQKLTPQLEQMFKDPDSASKKQ